MAAAEYTYRDEKPFKACRAKDCERKEICEPALDEPNGVTRSRYQNYGPPCHLPARPQIVRGEARRPRRIRRMAALAR